MKLSKKFFDYLKSDEKVLCIEDIYKIKYRNKVIYEDEKFIKENPIVDEEIEL